jgi:gliding motility-associated-like protein
MPNAFTPNNDNKNDLFRPIINCPTSEYSILIVNRYGQEIFSSNTPSDSWDGTFNGQKEGVGVYFYLVKVKFNYPNAQYEIYKGDVSLIR